MKTSNSLKKNIKHAFNKDIYLLGIDARGIKYWLEAPSWDCNWYLGFGYVETYTNNRYPEKARDIKSHQHWDSCIVTKSIQLKETTFLHQKKEIYSLFEQFYSLRNEAENEHSNGETARWTEINKVLIPDITAKILAILTPNK